jgi:hypothetical protein
LQQPSAASRMHTSPSLYVHGSQYVLRLKHLHRRTFRQLTSDICLQKKICRNVISLSIPLIPPNHRTPPLQQLLPLIHSCTLASLPLMHIYLTFPQSPLLYHFHIPSSIKSCPLAASRNTIHRIPIHRCSLSFILRRREIEVYILLSTSL